MIPFIWNYSSFFFLSHFFSDCDGQPDLRIIVVMVRVCSVAQSCTTPCDPMDCSPPGSSIHGILQARILEGVAISFSKIKLLHTSLCIFVCTSMFSSFGSIPSSTFAELYIKSVFISLRKHQIGFHSAVPFCIATRNDWKTII